jgi:hypothetical protein
LTLKDLEQLSVFPGLRTSVIVVVSNVIADRLWDFRRGDYKPTEPIDLFQIEWELANKLPVLRRSLESLFILTGGDRFPGWSWVRGAFEMRTFTRTGVGINPASQSQGGRRRFWRFGRPSR